MHTYHFEDSFGKVGAVFHWRIPHFILGCQRAFLERLLAETGVKTVDSFHCRLYSLVDGSVQKNRDSDCLLESAS
jgi:hypothetical protein